MRSKEKIIHNYNRISRWYDALAGIAEKGLQEAGLRMLNPAVGECLLEIGFGTGHSIVRLARAVRPSGRLYGIDISQRMLAIAEQRVAGEGVKQMVTLCRGDATGLPYSNSIFDGILMAFTLETFNESEAYVLLRQCKRVLKVNGRIVVVSMSQQGKPGIMMKIYQWAHVTFPEVVDCRPIYLEKTLRAAGFEVTEATVSPFWGLSVEMVAAVNTKPGLGRG